MKVNVAIEDYKGLKSFPHRREMSLHQKLKEKVSPNKLEKIEPTISWRWRHSLFSGFHVLGPET
jgi:hypothetical protein